MELLVRVAKQPGMNIESYECKDFKGMVTDALTSHC